jgi:hypothetical protein
MVGRKNGSTAMAVVLTSGNGPGPSQGSRSGRKVRLKPGTKKMVADGANMVGMGGKRRRSEREWGREWTDDGESADVSLPCLPTGAERMSHPAIECYRVIEERYGSGRRQSTMRSRGKR